MSDSNNKTAQPLSASQNSSLQNKSMVAGAATDPQVQQEATTTSQQQFIRIRGGVTEISDTKFESRQSRRSQATVKETGLKRYEMAGEKIGAEQVAEMANSSRDEMIGSVNIQTDAISFDKTKGHLNSQNTLRSAMSIRSFQSKRSGGGPSIPPPVYGQTQKINQERSSQQFERISVGMLRSQEEMQQMLPSNINAQIQRDNAMKIQNMSGDAESQLWPRQSTSSLLVPMHRGLVKQITGREAKDKKKNNSPFDSTDSFGHLSLPGLHLQRADTKVEKIIDEDSENYEQTPKSMFAIKAPISPKRPQDSQSILFSPSVTQEIHQTGDDQQTVLSIKDSQKPSVHFENTVTKAVGFVRQNTSVTKANDLKRQQSFQTQDSKNNFTVVSQIHILNPTRKDTNELQFQNQTVPEFGSDQAISQKHQQLSDIQSNQGGKQPINSTMSDNSAFKLQQINDTASKAQQVNNFMAQSLKIEPVLSTSLLTNTKIERQLTQGGGGGQSISGHKETKLIGRQQSTGKLRDHQHVNSSTLKNNVNGLVTIEEDNTIQHQQLKQQSTHNVKQLKVEELQQYSEQPIIQIQNLGELSPLNRGQRKLSDDESISVAMYHKEPNEEDNLASPPPNQILESISISTVPKKKLKESKKKKTKKADKEDKDEFKYEQDNRKFLPYQMFAQDFLSHIDGYDQVADDPSKIAKLITDNVTSSQADSTSISKVTADQLIKATSQASQDVIKDIQSAASIGNIGSTTDVKTTEKPTTTEDQYASTQDDASSAAGGFGLKRGNAINPKREIVEKKKAENERVTNLENQVAQLKDIMKRQKEFQEQVMTQMTQEGGSSFKKSGFGLSGGKNEAAAATPTVISNDYGYIGQIHQPVYNINIYPNSNKEHNNDYSDGRSESPEVLQPSFQITRGRQIRPSSSNVYAANSAAAAQAAQIQQKRKQRPMTAGGAGAKRMANNHIGDDPDMMMDQFNMNGVGGLKGDFSAIDFQNKERPISAATYQKLANRNQQAQVPSDGQPSDIRFRQEQALAEVLQNIQANFIDVPEVGQAPEQKETMKGTKERIEMELMRKQGHQFQPVTNLNTKLGVKRTQSCYLNVKSKKGVVPSRNYVQTASGKTGYVTVPNKSQKILEQAYKVKPKTLNQTPPLDLKTEPMRSLKSCVLTEMISLHKQRNRQKNAMLKKKNQKSESTGSRHAKLQKQANKKDKNKTTVQNADLLFSPIDKFMTENFPAPANEVTSNKDVVSSMASSNDSHDSRDSIPGLTGNSHILMERDFFQKKYALEQNGKKMEMSETHFQPIFMGKSANSLQFDKKAKEKLKYFNIFVKPEDFDANIVMKVPMEPLGMVDSLAKILLKNQERDLQQYRYKQIFIEALKEFDSNGDGKLSIEKVRHVMSKLFQKLRPQKIDEMIRDVNLDGDGPINYEEFVRKIMAKKETKALVMTSHKFQKEFKEMTHNPFQKRLTLNPVALANQKRLSEASQNFQSEIQVKKNTKPIQRRPLSSSSAGGYRMSYQHKAVTHRFTSTDLLRMSQNSRNMSATTSLKSTVTQQVVNSPVTSTDNVGDGSKQIKKSMKQSRNAISLLLSAPIESDAPKKVLLPLSEKEQSLIDRLARAPARQTREMIRQNLESRQKPKSNKITKRRASPKKLTIAASSPINSPASTSRAKMSQDPASNSPHSQASDKSSNIFSNQVGRLGQTPLLNGSPTSVVLEKKKKGSIPMRQNNLSAANRAASKTSAFRRVSASAGGGTYPLKAIESQRQQKINDIKITREKSVSIFSNSNQTQKIEATRKPQLKHEKSVMSAEPQRVKSNFGSKKRIQQQHKGTSSSDKYTNKSALSQKTGTVTDRRTDKTSILGGGQIKNMESKFSETQSNATSDITQGTRKERVPLNINLSVKVPVVPHQSESVLLDSSEKDLSVSRQGKSDDLPKKEWEMLIREEENVNIEITPLDDVVKAQNIFTQNKLEEVKIDDPQKYDAKNTKNSQNMQQNIKPQIIVDQLQVKLQSDNITSLPAYGTIMSPSNESKMPIFIDDSQESVLQHQETAELGIMRYDEKFDAVVQIVSPTLNLRMDVSGSSSEDLLDQFEEELGIAPSQQQVPRLTITDLNQRIRQQSVKDEKRPNLEEIKKTQFDQPFLHISNTDRNMKKEPLDNSPSSKGGVDDPQLNQALIVPPMSSFKRVSEQKIRQRLKTKDSQSSALTPMFYQRNRTYKVDELPGGTPSAKSEFSFAHDLNRRDQLADLKLSQGSNQSREMTKRRRASLFLSPTQTSKKTEDSRSGKNLGQISQTTSEERSMRATSNVDLIELGVEDVNQNGSSQADNTPKSQKVNPKPIFSQMDVKEK